MESNYRRRSAAAWLCAVGLVAGIIVAPAATAVPASDRIGEQSPADNGYQELVQAGELLRTSKLFSQAVEDSSTLTLKRRALSDRPVRRALALLRQGLSRPRFSPPEAKPDSAFGDFGKFRHLARLLRLQQYVLLADGRVPEAIGNARLGLRLGRVVQQDNLLSGLVGIAISSLGIHSLGAHLEQLSARDCELLYQVCLEWLRQPHPAPRVMEGERRLALRRLREIHREGEQAPGERGPKGGTPAGSAPGAVSGTAAEQQMEALFDRLLVEMQKPAWARKPLAVPETGSGAQVVALLVPALNQMLDTYTREQTQVRLMACHSAILRHRWEHEQLPRSLAELKLGALAVDPFTGQPLRYEVKGRGYRLTSAGPVAQEDDPAAVGGRRPVTVAPDGT